jgi:hypothetical protein
LVTDASAVLEPSMALLGQLQSIATVCFSAGESGARTNPCGMLEFQKVI